MAIPNNGILSTTVKTKTQTRVGLMLIGGGLLLMAAAAATVGPRLRELYYSGILNVSSDGIPAAGTILKAGVANQGLFFFSAYGEKEDIEIRGMKLSFVGQQGLSSNQLMRMFNNLRVEYRSMGNDGYGYSEPRAWRTAGRTALLRTDPAKPSVALAEFSFNSPVVVKAGRAVSFVLRGDIPVVAGGTPSGNFSVQIDEGKDVYTRGLQSKRTALVKVDYAKGNWLKVEGGAPTITVLSPNGGEKWEIGKEYFIGWQYTGLKPNENILIELFSPDTGKKSITRVSAGSPAYPWQVPSDITLSDKYKIRMIYGTYPETISDTSDNYFSIVAASLSLGDVNGNGRIDVGDSLFIAQYAEGKRQLDSTALANADVDGDGAATAIDAKLIAQYLVKKISKFPRESGALVAGVLSVPAAQSVVRGGADFTFANFVINAANTSEDIRVSSIQVQQKVDKASSADDVTAARLYDGTTLLTSGSHILNPAGSKTTNQYVINLDSPLIVAKGATKTIALKGNISGSAATNSFQQWGLASRATVSAVGVATGSSTPVVVADNEGQKMTILEGGSYSVSLDSSSPSSRLLVAGTEANVMTGLKFKAVNEAINIRSITFNIAGGRNLAGLSLYDGSTLLNKIASVGSLSSQTMILNPPFRLPANSEKVLTVKADIAPIYATNTMAVAGDKALINYVKSEGFGEASGQTITNSQATNNTNYAYIYRSAPKVSVTQSSNTFTSAGTKTISKFSVTADAKGDIDLYKFTFYLEGSRDVRLSNLTFTDVTGGMESVLYAGTTAVEWRSEYYDAWVDVVLRALPGTISGGLITPRTVAAGTTRTFELRANVSYTGTANSFGVNAYLAGDGAGAFVSSAGRTAAAVDADPSGDDFIWSDWSDADHSTNPIGSSTADWYNGYLVSGLSPAY